MISIRSDSNLGRIGGREISADEVCHCRRIAAIRLVFMTVLLAGAGLLTYYFHIQLGSDAVFSHFFYIPIIMAALWWRRKGLLVPIFLGGILIASHLRSELSLFQIIAKPDFSFLKDLFRIMMFFLVASMTAYLAGRIEETQRAVRENEARYRALFENIREGVVIFEAVDDGQDFVFLDINKTVEQIEGLIREEIIGKRLSELFSKAEEFGISDVYRKVWATGRSKKCAPAFYKDDRISGWRERFVYRLPTGEIVSVYNDRTHDMDSAEERKRLVAAIEHVGEGVMVTDTDGTVRYVNPTFERTTGYIREEIVGKTPRILKSGKHDQKFYSAMWDTLKKGKEWRGRMINKKKDDTLYEIEAVISPVKDSSGRIINYVSVRRDITDDVRLRRRLRQAQKMEAIGTLAGGIAHDFNNILFPIIGYIELAMEDLSPDSSPYQLLSRSRKGGRRAKELVDQILAFSRQTEQEKKPVKIRLIVKEALKLLRASIPSTIEIRMNLEVESDTVLADPTQIHQIVMNLCTNAFHAMKKKTEGVMGVELSETEALPDDRMTGLSLTPGAYLRLTVSDTGHGIARDLADKIFDPYFTTKPVGEGTGMGLAVVHGIVQTMGGRITFYSEMNKGSAFHVYLPLVRTDAVQEPDPSLPEMPAGKGEHILLVDDEEEIVDMVKLMLTRLGYQVTAYTAGLRALEAFRAEPDRFDLVITDMTMPKVTGIQLSRNILEIRPDIPIVLCTGFSDLAIEKNYKSLGIRQLLKKPLLKSDLGRAMEQILTQ